MADDTGRLNQLLEQTSFLYGGNSAFVEALYARWAKDPASVEPSWQVFFAGLQEPTADAVDAVRKPGWVGGQTPQARPDWLSALDGQ